MPRLFQPPSSGDEKLRDLVRCKRKVARCWLTDLAGMAAALAEIRDRQLWSGAYRSFSDCCEQEWGFQERFAVSLIEAATYGDGEQ